MLRTIRLSHPARSLLYNFYFKDNLTDGAGFFSYQSSLMGVIRIQQEQAARSEYQVKQSLTGHLLPVSFRIIITFFHIGQKVIVDALPSFKNQMHIIKFPMTFPDPFIFGRSRHFNDIVKEIIRHRVVALFILADIMCF